MKNEALNFLLPFIIPLFAGEPSDEPLNKIHNLAPLLQLRGQEHASFVLSLVSQCAKPYLHDKTLAAVTLPFVKASRSEMKERND